MVIDADDGSTIEVTDDVAEIVQDHYYYEVINGL